MSGDMTAAREADSAQSQDRSGAIDRRDALKKAALAAGVVAWTTPVVQVVSSGTAYAQTVTGCCPVVSITLIQTGSNCGACPCPTSRRVAATVSTLYWVQGLTVDCGPTCQGPAVVDARSSSQTSASPQTAPTASPSSPAPRGGRRSAQVLVRCPDGGIYQFDGRSPRTASPAPLARCTARVAPQVGVLDDEAATATSEPWAGSTIETTTTTTDTTAAAARPSP